MTTNDKQRLNLIFKFVKTFQKQIKKKKNYLLKWNKFLVN